MAEPKDGIAVAQVPVAVPAGVPVIGHYRWIICGRVFFAATVNYIDRKLIGLLRPILQTELHWNDIDYSYIVFAFQRAYAGGLLIVGRVMDWLGTRKGFSLAVFLWSVAAMAHALAHSLVWLRRGSVRAGTRRIRQFPGFHQDRRGVECDEPVDRRVTG